VKTYAIALFLALTACGGLPDHWEITGPAPSHVEEAIEAARQQAPCNVAPWGGKIEFVPAVFRDGGVWVRGCYYEDDERIVVATGADVLDTALVHELGHAAWTRCGMESASHPVSFLAWVTLARMATHGMEIGQR
jgi:hypothetical protein